MMIQYFKLAMAALLPVIVSVILYLLDKKTAFGKLNYAAKQVIFGVIFGGLAIFGTEFGIPINGAQMNCRDAAVLAAGLLFGSPAGIIAGTIGAVERWFAVYWGVGTFTRIACSVSTFVAGIYSALLRKFMFENKKPGWAISFAIGIVMEVFHLTMVFITNMSSAIEAMNIVKVCTMPMLISNGASVMFCSVLLSLIAKEKLTSSRDNVRISQTIQRWLLFTVFIAFAATSAFVFRLQNTIAQTQTDNTLDLAIEDTAADIKDASDNNLITLTYKIIRELPNSTIDEIAKKHGVSEISIINSEGIIEKSTNKDFVGFDMASGEQSAEFLCLLGSTREYAQGYGPITYDKSVMRKYVGVKDGSGFVQVGYDSAMFQKDISETVLGITKNMHVGSNGYVLIFNERYAPVSGPKKLEISDDLAETIQLYNVEPNTTFEAEINDEKCFLRYDDSEGYFIVSVLPQSEALQMRNIAIYVNTYMEVLVFAILFALIYLLIKRVVVNQIKKINKSLAKITGGNLDEVVDVRTNEEFASLSDDINSTVDTLKQYISDASARIDKELEFAKNIQFSALPRTFPSRKDYDIFASMQPAKEVGGDFYDFYMSDSETLNFLIADVSGKGIPAAMFMMRAKTELKSLTESEKSIADVFTHGNEALCSGNDAGMFVTAWQGGIDLATGLVNYANAGHNPPAIRKNGGKYELLKGRAGFVLAGMEGVKYKAQSVQLEPGDEIFLYTDGVTEATDSSEQLFGEERLLEALNSKEFESMNELCTYIKQQVDAFVGDAPQFDDITMLAFRYLGTPTITIENATIADVESVTDFVDAELEKIECSMKVMVQINVAIDELFSNIVKYGYPDSSGRVTVKVLIKDDPKTVYIRFSDEGIPYNPLVKEDPDVTLSAEERSIGGLGIYMVKKTMDDIRYKYENNQNILTIVKYL